MNDIAKWEAENPDAVKEIQELKAQRDAERAEAWAARVHVRTDYGTDETSGYKGVAKMNTLEEQLRGWLDNEWAKLKSRPHRVPWGLMDELDQLVLQYKHKLNAHLLGRDEEEKGMREGLV